MFISSRLKISRFYWEFYKYRIGKVEVGCRYDICFSIITQFVNNTYDMLQFSVYRKSPAFIETFLGVDVVSFVFFFSFFTCVIQCKNKFDCDKCDIPLNYNISLNKQNTLITVSKVNPIHNHTSVIGTIFFHLSEMHEYVCQMRCQCFESI